MAHRRFVQVLLALATFGLLAALGITATQFAKDSPESRAAAEQAQARALADQREFHRQCLADVPDGENPQTYCGPEPTLEMLGRVEDFGRRPFDFAEAAIPGSMAVTVGAAAVLFLVGATYVGADWASRAIVALLFWEPRRLTVVAVKTATVVATAAVATAVAQAIWVAGAWLLALTRGSPPRYSGGLAGDLAATQARGVGLAVFVALLGFGLTNLMRSTGAALGVGFIYFAVLENAVRGLRPGWSRWLVSENAAAMLTPGGVEVLTDPGASGDLSSAVTTLGNIDGAVYLLGVTATVIVVGAVAFKLRDLT